MNDEIRNTDAIIILAAGNSSRLGFSKQLLNIGNNSLLQHTVKTALQCCSFVVVVLGSEFEKHHNAISSKDVSVIENGSWQNGIGTSIKAGINYVNRMNKATDRILIMVCDQPFTTGAHIRNIFTTQKTTKKGIIASSYADTIGVPALFTHKYFSELQLLDDAQGAKSVINKNRDDVSLVAFPAGAIDIDTTEDIEQYKIAIKKRPTE